MGCDLLSGLETMIETDKEITVTEKKYFEDVEEYISYSIDGEDFDKFGYSVSIDNNYAIVGAYLEDSNGYSAGAAYILNKQNDKWVQQAKLTASDGEKNNFFGYSVSISEDHAIVGSYKEAGEGYTGSAHILKDREVPG